MPSLTWAVEATSSTVHRLGERHRAELRDHLALGAGDGKAHRNGGEGGVDQHLSAGGRHGHGVEEFFGRANGEAFGQNRAPVIGQLAGIDEPVDGAIGMKDCGRVRHRRVGDVGAAHIEQPGDVVGLRLDEEIGTSRLESRAEAPALGEALLTGVEHRRR